MFARITQSPRREPQSHLYPDWYMPRVGDWTIEIDFVRHVARRIDTGEPDVRAAFELSRHDENGGDTVYTLIETTFGEYACDCPDFQFRRRKAGEPCKHIFAFAATGLFSQPTVTIEDRSHDRDHDANLQRPSRCA